MNITLSIFRFSVEISEILFSRYGFMWLGRFGAVFLRGLPVDDVKCTVLRF